MTPEMRQQIVLTHEGQVLSLCNSGDADHACEVARCVIDGAINAMVRIQGAEETAKFAFALADRVTGGIRAPTDWRGIVSAPAPVAPSPPLKKSHWSALAFVGRAVFVPWMVGFLSGFLIGLRSR